MPATCRHVFGGMTFSLCPKESANILADIIPTRHVMSSSMVWTTESDDILGQHSQHFHDMSACGGRHVIWGGGRQHDMTLTFPTKLN